MVAKRIKRKLRDPDALVLVILCGLIIVVCGLSTYFYIKDKNTQIDKIQNARSVNRNKKEKLAKEKEQLLAISRLVGWRVEDGKFVPEGGWTNEDNLRNGLNIWAKKLKDEYQIDKYGAWDESGIKVGVNSLTVIDELEQLIDGYNVQVEEVKQQRDVHRQGESEVLGDDVKAGKIKELEKAKNIEIKSVWDKIYEMRTRITDRIKQSERTKERLERGIKKKTEQIINRTRNTTAEILEREKEILKLEERLTKLRRRLDIAEQGIQIDGEVIVADPKNGYAYVDLGQKDAVRKGLDFDIFSIEKGGLRKVKGKIKIIKIYGHYSQAAVIPDSTLAADPIAVGDYINSHIFDRKKSKIFAFAGQLIGRYSRPELTDRIRQAGGRTLEEISDEITYIIVGEGYEKDTDYTNAFQLGALPIREKELYSMIGLGWKD